MVGTLVSIITILTMIAAIVSCNGSTENNTSGNQVKENNPAAAMRQARDQKIAVAANQKMETDTTQPPPQGYFKKVSVTPINSSTGTSMKILVETTAPLLESQYLTYIFWKNNQKVMESKADVIPASYYKKRDFIFVDALLHEGANIVARVKSDSFQVENTAPVITDVTLPTIDGPGAYTFDTQATDADGDNLTFSLTPAEEDEALPAGMEMDAASGVVTYTLPEKAQPPETIRFIVSADDGDGGVAQKAVSLAITFEKITKQEKVAENKAATPPKKPK